MQLKEFGCTHTCRTTCLHLVFKLDLGHSFLQILDVLAQSFLSGHVVSGRVRKWTSYVYSLFCSETM